MANANRVLFWVISGCAGLALGGQAVLAGTWDGSEASDNWSTPANWSDNQLQTNADVLFNNTDPTTAGVVNNVVDSSLTINSLTYANTGTNWQVTQIATAQVLTIDAVTPGVNAVWVGTVSNVSSYQSTTYAAITGPGKLVVNEPTANLLVSTYTTGTSGGTSANSTASLDLSSLGELQAHVDVFSVGYGRGANGILRLAGTNTITANSIAVGRAEWTGSSNSQSVTSSTIYLGETNVLNTTNLLVGANLIGTINKNANSGTLIFAEGVSPAASVTIRGTDGSSAVTNMIVGNIGGDNANGAGGGITHESVADFTGGTVDALVTNLTIGAGSPAAGSKAFGTLSMDTGTFVAGTVRLGTAGGGGSTASGQAVQGTLNVAGGVFTADTMLLAAQAANFNAATTGILNVSGGQVTVADGFTMGSGGNGNTVARTAQINVTGGVLSVGGNIAEGANGNQTSTISISGGEMRMTAGDITVDSLSLTSGGQLTLFVGAVGENSEIRGSGSATLDGTLAFDLTAASTTLNDSWVIVAPTVSLSYGSNFEVAGFTQIAGLWYDTADVHAAKYLFDPSVSTLTVVPEPGAGLGLLAAAGMGLMRRSRRQV